MLYAGSAHHSVCKVVSHVSSGKYNLLCVWLLPIVWACAKASHYIGIALLL